MHKNAALEGVPWRFSPNAALQYGPIGRFPNHPRADLKPAHTAITDRMTYCLINKCIDIEARLGQQTANALSPCCVHTFSKHPPSAACVGQPLAHSHCAAASNNESVARGRLWAFLHASLSFLARSECTQMP